MTEKTPNASTHIWPEIVTVLDDRRLADARSEVHPYWRRNGEGLAPGLYVAVRQPAGFNEESEFRGPFRRTEEAQAALQKLAAHVLRWSRGWRPVEGADRLRRGADNVGFFQSKRSERESYSAQILRRLGERPLPPKQ